MHDHREHRGRLEPQEREPNPQGLPGWPAMAGYRAGEHETVDGAAGSMVHGQLGEHAGGRGVHVSHAGHEQIFRRRFWICLALSIPVLVFSPTLQAWLRYTLPAFPGRQWIAPVFAVYARPRAP